MTLSIRVLDQAAGQSGPSRVELDASSADEDELLLAIVDVWDGGTNSPDEAGWTQHTNVNLVLINTGAGSWSRYATDSEGTYTWTVGDSTSYGILLGISSTTGGTAIVDDGAASADGHTGSGNLVAPSVTAADDDSILVWHWVQGNVTATLTLPGSMTSLVNTINSGGRTRRAAHEVVANGATGTRTATSDVTDGNPAAGPTTSVVISEEGGATTVTAAVEHGIVLGHQVDATLISNGSIEHGLVLGHQVVGTVEEETVTAAVEHGVVLGHSVAGSSRTAVDVAHGLALGHAMDATLGGGAAIEHGLVLGYQVTGAVEVPVIVDVAHGLVLGHQIDAQVPTDVAVSVTHGLVLGHRIVAHSDAITVGRPIQPLADARPIMPLAQGRPIMPTA